jgi:anti-sigma B factor antagonist
MTGELMQIQASGVEGGHVVRARGEIDVSTAPRLAEALVQFANGSVTVDLTGVTFLDSSGCSALIAAHNHLERRGSHLYVRGADGMVLRVLELMGLSRLLNLDGDQPAA